MAKRRVPEAVSKLLADLDQEEERQQRWQQRFNRAVRALDQVRARQRRLIARIRKLGWELIASPQPINAPVAEETRP